MQKRTAKTGSQQQQTSSGHQRAQTVQQRQQQARAAKHHQPIKRAKDAANGANYGIMEFWGLRDTCSAQGGVFSAPAGVQTLKRKNGSTSPLGSAFASNAPAPPHLSHSAKTMAFGLGNKATFSKTFTVTLLRPRRGVCTQ